MSSLEQIGCSGMGALFSSLFGGWASADDVGAGKSYSAAAAGGAEKSHASGASALALNDAARKAGEMASAAVAAIKEAAETAVTYVSGLFGTTNSSAVVVSAYGKLQRAAGAAANTVVELVKRLLGSDAVAAAKGQFDGVAAALRGGSSSFAATVVAALDAACSAVFPAGTRETLAAVLWDLAPAAKAVASFVEKIRAIVRAIPLVEKLLGVVIPPEVKNAIAVLAVAAALCLTLCGGNAGAPAAMMNAPGSGALQLTLLRSAFQANPAAYFRLLRSAGPKCAAAAFGFPAA